MILNFAQTGLVNWINTGGSIDPLPSALRDKFSLLWLGSISGNSLVDVISGQNIVITGKDFATDYIPPTSTATFSLPDVAGLKTDDNFDGLWYTDAGAVKQVPVSYFINNDYSRTLVKYSNASPYNVEWIGLLKNDASISAAELEQLHTYFMLHVYWTGIFNDGGVVKDNRGMSGLGYKAWIATCETTNGFTGLSNTVKASINKYCLDLINYGIFSKDDRRFLWMLNDNTLLTTYGTVSLCNSSSTRGTFPVSPTYTTRGIEGNATNQYFNSQFTPSTQGINYAQNSARRSVYQYKAKTAGTSYIDGHAGVATDVMTNGASTTLQRINASNSISSGVSLDALDYIAINRSAASGAGSVSIYEGTTKLDFNVTSTALAAEVFTVLRAQFGYGDAGYSFWSAGASLTQTEHANDRTAFLAHKTRLGL